MQAPVSFRWGVVVATAVALVVVWGGYAHVARTVLHDHIKVTVAQAETMARGFENSTHRAVREVDISLRNLGMELEEGGVEHARRIADQDLYDRNLIRRFTVFDIDGRPVFRSDGNAGAQSRCESAAFAHFKGGGPDELRIGQPYADPNCGPGIPFSRRVAGPDGRFDGIVVANVDPQVLADFYRQANLGPRGSVTLVGLDKVIRARGAWGEQDAVGLDISHSRLWEELDRARAGVYWQETRTDGLLRAYAYRALEGYPLLVAVGVAMADMEDGVADLRRTLLIIAALLTSSTVLVAAFLLVQHRTSERLRAALTVNRDFLARISHELRTPLNAILGFSEVIRDQLLGSSAGPRYAGYAKDIHDSGRHLLSLIDDILDLARLQAGDLPLDPRPLDIAATVQWAIRMMAPQAQAKHIRLDMHVDPATPSVTADDRAMKQMLLNLLSNAVTFTPEGGRILVRAAGARGCCRIEVVDNGIGMTPEQLNQAVVPFGQPTAMVVRPGQGSGLGLSIVKSLMEAHGGRLRIDSRPGEGSRFTLEFGGRALC
ncbi:sensor histidine kinase [Azospirillum rugosum]|uniref:histidine kinase n=1 Tax=Azospirillum rugosum TaxID=416170 RepID=A0ABS4SJT6_9PROT|nr:ATP-binding protein [Azospirillum rugosum]MBP2292489.1 signal transduction histidine kinase [Azospirillum rugosum]MDQ0526487.1 signal transduction histidine kinase [Azospirillum rugosum]